MKHKTIAVDIAKNVFEIAVSDTPGRVCERQRVSRARFLRWFGKVEPATVLLEACGSSHHWGRELEKFGHRVMLLPPHLVRPYRRYSKHDRADTKAILEAHRNEEILAVPIKNMGQTILASLHRLRSGWLQTRTARINTVRGLLRELGVFIPVGAHRVVPQVSELVEDAESGLPDALRGYLYEACAEIRELESRMSQVEKQLRALAEQDPAVKRLLSIPGIGLLTATAMVGFIGGFKRFRCARHFSSYLGLVPREHSSGNIRRMGHISKHGDGYIRMLLTHGARSVLYAAERMEQPDRLRSWAVKIKTHRGHNKAVVALANKLARIAWAVSTRNQDYQSMPLPRLA
jgi:transposase